MNNAPKRTIKVGNLTLGNHLPFVLIAGPCVLESEAHATMMATEIKAITDRLDIGFIFKSSYDKANRTSINGVRGLGMDAGLRILSDIKRNLNVPITTDVHAPEHCAIVAKDVDVLQIPAFLCRQTDLLVAAAKTGRAINVKKGQFLAPWDMINVVKKISAAGNDNIMQCERGVSFGYNRLINDMRALPIMAQSGYPVCFDATHSVQEPGGKGDATGGERQHVQVLARSAVSLGIASLFLEVHDNPDTAPSDGPNMVRLDQLEALLTTLKAFDTLAKSHPILL